MYKLGFRFTPGMRLKPEKVGSIILIRSKNDRPRIPGHVFTVKDILRQNFDNYYQGFAKTENCGPTGKKEDKNYTRVCVVGSTTKVGSTLSLMLKTSPLINSLHLHDDCPTNFGVGLDLSHIDTKCKIEAFTGQDALPYAVKGAQIVVVCATEDSRGDNTLESMFYFNAGRVADIAAICAQVCPNATIAVLAQPINCLVPLMHEIFHRELIEKPKVLGIPTINVVRASTMLSAVLDIDPRSTMVPCLGGASAETIVPILSHAQNEINKIGNENVFQDMLAAAYYPCRKPDAKLHDDQISHIMARSDEWILKEKGCNEGATMAPAYSGARFVLNMVRGMMHQPGEVVDVAYVRTRKVPGMKYCCLPVVFGADGIMRQCTLPSVSKFEEKCLNEAKVILAPQIKMGEDFAQERITRTMPFTFL